MSGGPAGGGMSGGGTGLMSGGGLSIGIRLCRLLYHELSLCKTLAGSSDFQFQTSGLHTSSPMARISASALLCSTTPGRMR
jgi:hypothetical protein